MIVYNHISQLRGLIENEIKSIIDEEPVNMQNDIRGMMNQPHGGRIYHRRGVTHQASAPGEAPAIDTGNLVASVTTKALAPMKSAVQSDAVYSLALELGRPEINLKPRPAWIPASKLALGRIKKRMNELKKAVERV